MMRSRDIKDMKRSEDRSTEEKTSFVPLVVV